MPFSFFDTVPHIDKAYPNSKYILTVRDNADQWYQSLTKYHAQKFGKNGLIPTIEDLRDAEINHGKYLRSHIVDVYGTTEDDPYNKDRMSAHYEKHNKMVMNYFKDRPDDLLVINIADSHSYQKLVDFIGVESPFFDFPWKNKT